MSADDHDINADTDGGRPGPLPRGLFRAMGGRDPRVEELLSYFRFDHLPPVLQDVSRPFCESATTMVNLLPADTEALVFGLHSLLLAKDSFVRAMVNKLNAERGEPVTKPVGP